MQAEFLNSQMIIIIIDDKFQIHSMIIEFNKSPLS